ncbi:MAG: glutathione synthase, partial [Acidiferrobacteraceae bacterium]|nr:glutathione synthase [Acidiferrobacteraceae bacterium]
MKHLFIADPLENIKVDKDTSYFLMVAAYSRGHEVYFANSSELAADHNQVTGCLQRVHIDSNRGKFFSLEKGKRQSLGDMDVIWLRTDPPVNRAYFYTTLLLDLVPHNVQIINRPSTIRDWNEKLIALQYPNLTPRTLVSRDLRLIRKFSEQFSRVTIKPIDGHGGLGIIFASSND